MGNVRLTTGSIGDRRSWIVVTSTDIERWKNLGEGLWFWLWTCLFSDAHEMMTRMLMKFWPGTERKNQAWWSINTYHLHKDNRRCREGHIGNEEREDPWGMSTLMDRRRWAWKEAENRWPDDRKIRKNLWFRIQKNRKVQEETDQRFQCLLRTSCPLFWTFQTSLVTLVKGCIGSYYLIWKYLL